MGEAVSTTTVRDASAPRRAATGTRPPVRPRAHAPRSRLRVVLTRYLAGAFLLLLVALLMDPFSGARRSPAERGAPWAYQRETLDVEGGGLLNAYARTVMGTTAWLAEGSIERQRDLYRTNLLELLLGEPAARGLAGWRQEHRLALEGTTQVTILGLVAYGLLARPRSRAWLLAVLLLLALTLLLTKPQTIIRAASTASMALPKAALWTAGQVEPGGGSTEELGRRLGDRYWRSFVSHPHSRLVTGGSVLADVKAEDRSGLLSFLRQRTGAVNDWALGRHGLERAFVATSALVYVLPFAIAVAALAMLAACAQTVVFVLVTAGFLVLPLGLERRGRVALMTWWLLPLLGAAAVLALTSLLSVVLMRLGTALHATDEQVGLLLAGSIWPVLLALLAQRWLAARRRARRAAAAGTVNAPEEADRS